MDWQLSAKQLERCVRAFNPWPVSYFMLDDQPVKVWQAAVEQTATDQAPGTILRADKSGIHIATGDGILILTQLQPAGKKAMTAQELLNSRRDSFQPGTVLA